jgi:CRISP-associated protein Cas1
VVAGHGSHIKATRDHLIIHHHGKVTEVPLTNLDHLIIIGGHHLQTSAVTSLVHENIFLSFFESDGEPSGFIRPYGYQVDADIQEQWNKATPYSYALTFAKGVTKERLLAIEHWNEGKAGGILYAGELDILDQAVCELDSMIKIDEINRIDRLIGDMYYEILSRTIDPSLQFKRRTERPYRDPVNAILSFGYAMLIATTTRALIGVHLDPDDGMLNRGKRSLALDFCNCWKTRMIDTQVLAMIQKGVVHPSLYENGEKRCILHESLIKIIIDEFQKSISQEKIDTQVRSFVKSLYKEEVFQIHRI